jgi:hypothetical protein
MTRGRAVHSWAGWQPPGDELEAYLTRALRDPRFRRAYEKACRRMYMGATGPLCIDGSEYHRRQQARKGRRR